MCSREGLLRSVEVVREAVVSGRGTAAVADGSKVRLTPLRQCIVPPPMCAASVILPSPAQALAFRNAGDREILAAVVGEGRLFIAGSVEDDLWEVTAEEAGGVASPEGEPLLEAAEVSLEGALPSPASRIRALTWLGQHHLLALASQSPEVLLPEGPGHPRDLLLELRVSWDWVPEAIPRGGSLTGPSASLTCLTETGGGLLQVVASSQEAAFLQYRDGTVRQYRLGGHLDPHGSLPAPCPRLLSVPASPSAVGNDLVGLSARGQLYLGARCLSTDCTSVVLRESGPGGAFLLYTTTNDLLCILPLSDAGSNPGLTNRLHRVVVETLASSGMGNAEGSKGVGPATNPKKVMKAAMRGGLSASATGAGTQSRSVESGALLVAAPPGDHHVVMQLPRGNLERIAPRRLLLSSIAAALDEHDYSRAWELVLVNRVDPNILTDYAWPDFLKHTTEFVEAVADDRALADFIAALREDSVLRPGGLYPDLHPLSAAQEEGQDNGGGRGKVERVCEALGEALEAAGADEYLRPRLTALCRQGQLEAALRLVKKAKEAELAGSLPQNGTLKAPVGEGPGGGAARLGRWRAGATRSLVAAEEGLRHLLLTHDVDRLYRTALGMYELELAYMVVAAGQRDPGEYLAELSVYAARPPGPLRREAIDMALGRFSSALRNLVEAGPSHFPSALKLARDKGLLRELIGQLKEGEAARREALLAYAADMAAQNRAEDSALAFLAAGDREAALDRYHSSGQWQMALALAGQLEWNEEDVEELARDLMEGAAAMGRHADAGAIAAYHLKDVAAAVPHFCRAGEWREAMRLAGGLRELQQKVVGPLAAEAASSLLSEISENRERVDKYLDRYKQVQAKRESMAVALGSGVAGENPDEMEAGGGGGRLGELEDSGTDAESVVSGMSAYTSGTQASGTSRGTSGFSPSTVGGRSPRRSRQKQARKGGRIRQGSPGEEMALAAHIRGLVPEARTLLAAGHLAEALVMLGHESDARSLQQYMSGLVEVSGAAAAYVDGHPPPQGAGPSAGSAPTAPHWKWDLLRAA
eukprot:jgi/Botrbrau1/282/Bobra.0022s0250.1